MPTTRPRYQITETPEVARALDLAARRWPREPRSKLVVHLIRTGGAVLAAEQSEAEVTRLAAIDSVAGKYTAGFGEHHLDELRQMLAVLPGTLTATLHAAPEEEALATELLTALGLVAGRVLYGGWPTGVAVSHAQRHGGPYPSTTSVHTSVGTTAIRRWMRPVAFQPTPDALLPPALQEANPLGIPRRIDGVLTLPPG